MNRRWSLILAGFAILAANKAFPADEETAKSEAKADEKVITITETVVVEGRTESPLSTTASSISLLGIDELRILQTPRVPDVLRYLPGVQVNQTGHQGGVSGVFVRGADPRYNLVTIDGVKVNDFGGAYNFSGLSSELLESAQLTRGPQSAAFGSYAVGGAFHFNTLGNSVISEEFVSAEAGSYGSQKAALGGVGSKGNFSGGVSLSIGRSDGVVVNDDSRFSNLNLKAGYKSGSGHSLRYGFTLYSNELGNPGPYGSDPAGLFPGIDTVSRTEESAKVNTLTYDGKIGNKIRERISVAVYSNGLDFEGPYGPSFSKQKRWTVSTDTSVPLGTDNILVFGGEWNREQFRNSFVVNPESAVVPLMRDTIGVFMENHFNYDCRLFVNIGGRLEYLMLNAIPTDAYGSRPEIPESVAAQVHPKFSAAYMAGSATKLHGSFGTGLRPPDGFELAFTTNPALKPERVLSYDAGVQQKLFNDRVVADATWFYNRFHDQIVTLSEGQNGLSRWQSDNLANSMTRGLEFSLRVQVNPHVSISSTYTYLDTAVLALDGSSEAQNYFRVGQALPRRPKHSGTYLATLKNERVIAHAGVVARGEMTDIEPNYGISAGQFINPYYATLETGLQVRLFSRLWLTSRVSNVFDKKYEESLGFPALGRTITAGLRWRKN